LKEKQLVIDEIKEKLGRAKSTVVIDYIGTTVAEADAMRKKLRESDVDYTVYKNTLVKRAIEGTQYEPLGGILEGPSAFALSYEDAVAPTRVLNSIFKEYKKMAFKAGIIEGDYFDADGLTQIALLPTRDELIAKFLGSIQSPISKLVRTFQAISDSKDSGAPVEAAVEKPAEAAAAAVEKPAEAVVEAAAAVETPADAIAEASAEAAVEKPAEAPAEAVVEAPVEKPAE
jgi:large subunit ribosomal protein L10